MPEIPDPAQGSLAMRMHKVFADAAEDTCAADGLDAVLDLLAAEGLLLSLGEREEREEWGVRYTQREEIGRAASLEDARSIADYIGSTGHPWGTGVPLRRTVITITYADGATTVHTTGWQEVTDV